MTGVCAILCSLVCLVPAACGEPKVDEATVRRAAWVRVEEQLSQRGAADFQPNRRPLWRHLGNYLRAQWAQSPAQRQVEMLERWAHVGDSRRFEPLLVEPVYQICALREVGSVEWRGSERDTYRVCLLPLPGQVVLFAYPDQIEPLILYQEHAKQLTRQRNAGFLQSQAYDRIRAEMERMREDRWAFVMLRVLEAPPSGAREIPGLQFIKGQPRARWEGGTQPVQLPDERTLSLHVGRPMDAWEIPPPDDRRVYFAVDWSRFLAEESRRRWLLAELQFGLRNVPDHWLIGESIYLQNEETAVTWPLRELRESHWPTIIPASHERATLGALAKAVAAAELVGGHVRLIFLTWNTEVSIEVGSAESGLITTSLPSDLVARVRALQLRILQMHGQRLMVLEALAGKENYDICEFRPEGPPVLQLFEQY